MTDPPHIPPDPPHSPGTPSSDWAAAAAAELSAGRPEAAERVARRALALCPGDPRALCVIGLAALARGDPAAALDPLGLAAAAAPADPAVRNNLGEALRRLGRVDEALACYAAAVGLRPDYADAHFNAGLAYRSRNALPEAVAAYRRAVALRPAEPDFHLNLAVALLLGGNLGEGFAAYEWRWRSAAHGSPRRAWPRPQWYGEPVAGRVLLLHAEQGFGDTLQFCRYAPVIAARWKARVVLEVQPGLARLARTLAGPERVVTRGEAVGEFDLHCPLMSVPLAVGTTMPDRIPADVPYLHADPAAVSVWSEWLTRMGATGRRVGLAWAGRPTHRNDRNRTVGLAALAPLADAAGVTFVSLQQGERAGDPAPPGLRLLRPGAFADFADAAALVAELDLVIAVDTAAAHLAGALGRPCWLVNPFLTDWRWGASGEATPWYPGMRLFRQATAQEGWADAVDRLRVALRAWAADPPTGAGPVR